MSFYKLVVVVYMLLQSLLRFLKKHYNNTAKFQQVSSAKFVSLKVMSDLGVCNEVRVSRVEL